MEEQTEIVNGLYYPKPKTAKELLEEAINKQKMITIYSHCTVDYDGRASSYLPEGDRLIILKPDGTTLVHSTEKHNPKNWQPPGATAKVKIEDEEIKIISKRSNPNEIIEVSCSIIYNITSYDATDKADLNLTGTEKDMHERIMKNPEVIEEGFKSLENEKKIEKGSIDIYGKDINGNNVVIEVKRRRAALENIDQLKRYVDLMREKEKESNVRGILVAPSASEKVKENLKKSDLEFVELKPRKNNKESHTNTKLESFSN